MTNLKDLLDGEKREEFENAIAESEAEKEREARRKRREATKYGGMLEDD